MAKLKEKFIEMKNSMPKHVRWLLLGAAFLVVLILLVLLMTGNKKKADPVVPTDDVTEAVLYIGPSNIEWLTVDVGSSRTQKIIITASINTKIAAVKFSKEVPGLSFKSDCPNIGMINENVPCSITLEWTPAAEIQTTVTEIQIMYYPAGLPDSFAQTERVQVALAARAKSVEPEPVIAEPVFIEPEPVPFEPEPIVVPEPVPLAPLISDQTVKEACYEYAFAGYDNAGNHSGWIRAAGGRYLYHPFSDTTCSNPMGEYNINTGMITAMGNASQKIGTDAEHIGWGVTGSTLAMPVLSNPATVQTVNRARQLELATPAEGGGKRIFTAPEPWSEMRPSSLLNTDAADPTKNYATVSSKPYDRTFVLRQYKPIPATIVSEIRATTNASRLPVQATVDRNVYSDNGRTVVVPAGTLMIGAVSDTDMPGPYKSIGRVNIEWFRFVRPDGVEFNFTGEDNRPFGADSQGRAGVPGRGSTDYLEQFIMPMLTAIVPAAVNLIAPISDRFVNQIDLDNNTVVQSGTVRSSELAKNEIITTWNKVAEKLAIDMLDNQTPPFAIAAGTRITVFSPTDLIVTCGDPDSDSRNCAVTVPDSSYAVVPPGGTSAYGHKITIGESPENKASLIGQARAYEQGIDTNINDARVREFMNSIAQYEAKNNAAWNEYYNQAQTGNAATSVPKKGTTEYNEQVLGLKTNEAGQYTNPFEKEQKQPEVLGLSCEDGTMPDANGCCTGEVYTDMGDQGFNCCPGTGGDCFPPIL